MTVNAVALCRVSTHRQSNENHSLPKQRTNVDAAASKIDAQIVKYWEVATSSKKGRNLQRKDLQAMLAFCGTKKNKIEVCIVDEVDRFMRSVEEYYWYKVELARRGVRLVFASNPGLSESSQLASFQELIAIYQAEAENTSRSEKVTSHMKATISRGYWPFPVKPGYQRTLTPGLHEPDPYRFPLIKQAMLLILNGTHTIKEAQTWLNNQGYRTKSGNILDLDKFTAMLREPYYCGKLQVRDWPTFNGIHQRMITAAEFERLQVIVDGRKVAPRNRHYNPEFPGQKTLSCGKCGTLKRVTGSRTSNGHGGSFYRYYCIACKKYWNRDKVHMALEEYLENLRLSPVAIESLQLALSTVWMQKNNDRKERASIVNTKIINLSDTKARLVTAYATTEDEDMKLDINTQIVSIRRDIRQLEQEREGLLDNEAEIDKFIEFALKYIDKLASNWWSLPPDARLWCQKILFPGEIIVYPDYKIGTNELSIIYTLGQTNSSPKAAHIASMVELPGTAPGSKR